MLPAAEAHKSLGSQRHDDRYSFWCMVRTELQHIATISIPEIQLFGRETLSHNVV
jgi:hypothetical protein